MTATDIERLFGSQRKLLAIDDDDTIALTAVERS